MPGFKKYNQTNNQGKDRRYGFDRQGSHKAICSKCAATCEVPFKPNGKKPVYCSKCFRSEGQRNIDTNVLTQPFTREFPQKNSQPYATQSHGDQQTQIYQLKEKLQVITAKLDQILMKLSKPPYDSGENTQAVLVKNAEITADAS